MKNGPTGPLSCLGPITSKPASLTGELASVPASGGSLPPSVIATN